ncbi:hypothetical protein BAE44_0017699 [Dichanthelium oligosanthes]|uniref:4Fe-4S ferredoxin-type domain-containing protein n=1 Tax=Dichanthelium oligosanthes TaxID=888268 RepID=A0A1E5V809_9POAL|nr:hypothetical protein BAE44_0017699 [Dichanthelium oligosanthes]
MGRPLAPVLALAIVAIAASAQGEVKCGGCTPCVGADCPVMYPSPPPPALPPPPPDYYYSPPPPATYYPGSYCPPPPGAYIQIGSTPPGKGPLYPQDPGFMPSAAPSRSVPFAVGVLAALASVWAAAFL